MDAECSGTPFEELQGVWAGIHQSACKQETDASIVAIRVNRSRRSRLPFAAGIGSSASTEAPLKIR
jgi:hypothetical protein